jgi:hypothetical protein
VARAPITPKTVVCTWRTNIAEPGYLLEGYRDQLRKSTIKIPRKDDRGTYTEIRRIYRKPIDATCLRVNRQFLSEGSAILYGKNTFCCTYIPSYLKEKGILRTLGNNGQPILRYAKRPSMRDIRKPTFIQSVRNLMEGRESDDNLEGWIYCDPLLRFIRTIGPSNAATLRALCLGGRPIEYDLQFYGPFIEKYCPRIRKLTVGPVWLYDYHLSHSEMVQNLFKTLRYGLARFQNLKELVVTDEDEQLVSGTDELMNEICKDQAAKALTKYRKPRSE